MMTKSKFNPHSKLRILSIIPVAFMLLLGIACVNETPKQEVSIQSLEEIEANFANYFVDGEAMENISDMDPELIYSVDIDKKSNTIHVITKTYQEEHIGSAETLIILNGEPQKEDFDMETIDPENIKTVDVIKDEEKIKEYTNKDYGGVIVIETK